MINGDIIVASVFEGSPAYEKGFAAATSSPNRKRRHQGLDQRTGRRPPQAARAGTFVNISLRRAGHDKLIDLRVRATRCTSRPSPRAFMLDDTTGYIKLTEFAENSDRELGARSAISPSKGMKRLVFDLRGNPGGQLDQAILRLQPLPAEGRHGRLHARPRAEFGSGLSRAPSAATTSRMPMITLVNRTQRERLGDRVGRAAGSRSLARHRRDDVRQGARAVGVSRSAGGAGARASPPRATTRRAAG